jgi:hypothetical protein
MENLRLMLSEITSITVSECCSLLNIPSYQQSSATSRRLGEILRKLGFTKVHTKKGNIWEKL